MPPRGSRRLSVAAPASCTHRCRRHAVQIQLYSCTLVETACDCSAAAPGSATTHKTEMVVRCSVHLHGEAADAAGNVVTRCSVHEPLTYEALRAVYPCLLYTSPSPRD